MTDLEYYTQALSILGIIQTRVLLNFLMDLNHMIIARRPEDGARAQD
jgi:hypothetical protein